MLFRILIFFFFFFNDTATTEIYTLSLHDALPICDRQPYESRCGIRRRPWPRLRRSEEHTSELQSRFGISYALFCLKKKKKKKTIQAQQPCHTHTSTLCVHHAA